ncbi:hypothetical protein [Streptomyces sp. NPDC001404]|uniref:hypothetical protein n=1 Tax=Streptomyces sp. NPDC001404 TaxID=3364571 RepID=UPI0036D00D9A
MRRVPGVGVVVCAVAALAVSGCSGRQASAVPEPSFESGAAGASSGSPSSAPATPEEAFNRLVLSSAFYFDGQGTGSASDAMKRYCDLLDEPQLEGLSPAQWLAQKQLTRQDSGEVLREGVARFCPGHAKTLQAAVEGGFERRFTDGTYTVGSGPGQIAPGTYRTTGALRDCYWERTARSGEVLDNQYATSAQEVEVTVQSGDGQFTTRRCGSWKPVA